MASTPEKQFLGYLHSFRGFAIINIVAIHAVVFALFMVPKFDWNPKNPIVMGNEILFHNSTIYFAVISGILYVTVLQYKGFKAFFMSKLKYVLLPYLFFTVLFSMNHSTPENWYSFQPSWASYWKDFFRNLVYGKADFQYWYIPVLFFMYLVTPLLDYFIKIPKWGFWLMGIFIFIPLVFRRIELEELMQSNQLSLQTMLYFTGAYAAGMVIGLDLEKSIAWIKKYQILLWAISIVSTIILIYCSYNLIDKFGFFGLKSCLFYLQKMGLSLLVLLWLKNKTTEQPKWMQRIANYSFTIYFLHAFFLGMSMGVVMPIFLKWKAIDPFNIILGAFVLLILTLLLSILVAIIFKKIFGKNSRMIVGS